MEHSSPSNKTGLTVAVLIAFVVIVAAAMYVFKPGSTASDSGTTGQSSDSTSSTASSSTRAQSASYKDGTYSASASYRTPEGRESINVQLTVKNNIVTDVNETSSMGNRESREYQQRFESGYKDYVVGKSLSSIQLSRVSGSSLTSNGFNQALDEIATQAKA